MRSNEQKIVLRTNTRKGKFWQFLATAVVFFVIVLPTAVDGYFNEDFESYNCADYCDIGTFENWTGTLWGLKNDENVCKAGAKCLEFFDMSTTYETSYILSSENMATGSISFWIKNATSTFDVSFAVEFYEDSTLAGALKWDYENHYILSDGQYYSTYKTFVGNVWYQVFIEWNETQYRWHRGADPWSNYYDLNFPIVTGINKFSITHWKTYGAYHNFIFDDLVDNSYIPPPPPPPPPPANTIFEEDFESYTIGNFWSGIDYQGSEWETSHPDLQNLWEIVSDGTQVLRSKNSGGFLKGDIYRTGTSTDTSRFGFRFKQTSETGQGKFEIYKSGNSDQSGAYIELLMPDDILTFRHNGSAYYTLENPFTRNVWHEVIIEWRPNGVYAEQRIKYDGGFWSDWLINEQASTTYAWDTFRMKQTQNDWIAVIDDLGENAQTEFEIDSPATETEQSQTFNITGTYNLLAEEWDRIMIIFEEWDASSTCAEYGSDDWETEWDQGMFYYQSIPFFSPMLTTSTGAFSVTIDDLRTGNYNCIKCYFINESLGTMTEQKCRGYTLNINDIQSGVPSFYFPFLDWETYYSTNTDQFATSTKLFENMAEALRPIVDKMGDFILFANTYFDASKAKEKGNELGQAIPKARGYLSMIDDFIPLPLSSFFIFFILTSAVVISYKIILVIIKLFKP